ncbi:hypothetical protein P153DRAFT_330411 [Dothidotthia symphoricarpi CBS 119687]|uniref:DUF1365-domain-containing protein n=1 Tax=Dothidotthia symphoricarpi CBS 119687 TaxID=1392245 RepID=A0A6A6APJ7_9PLEO|nr:uncharacterized protein P153DRAFT_330411 [Dothidotthia symphoricarpi CBS 119687]KAF2133849.1 hypothetical protein P153DRAFT_330411 [Dothidotthia symphoricarpi CBS 119687]
MHYGLFDFFACSSLTIVLCFLDSGMDMWSFLATWTMGGGVRWYYGDRQLVTDCFVLGTISTWLVKEKLVEILLKGWKDLDVIAMSPKSHPTSSVAITLVILGLSLWHVYGGSNSGKIENLPPGARKWSSVFPKATILPCQTMHARMFPKRHAFQNAYLQCGFPIVPDGTTSDGADVGLGNDRELGSWWLRVKADDYLERGYGALGFYGKLQLYLKQQHVSDSDWSYAYLVTAPRFFGYAFNPVSFWYIYDQDHQLTKMILEVNNTFGERRVYLLEGSGPLQTPGSSVFEEPGPLVAGAKSRFTHVWMKDFHVSPFSSRKGFYALKARNPFPFSPHDRPEIDNTITLKSSKDYAKVVARLHSTGSSLDPNQLGVFGTLRFLLSWWWVGLVTFPRILKQTIKLHSKNLRTWVRPEVLSSSIGRSPTSSEIVLQKIFYDYLLHLIHGKECDFRITLYTAIPDYPKQIIVTVHQRGREQVVRDLEIRVLTPAFYSRFVHYSYASEAFDRECIFTDEKNRTLWVSRPELLPLLLSQPDSAPSNGISSNKRSYMDELRWTLLRKLRCSPAEPAYPVALKASNLTVNDIRTLPFSEMDTFVRGNNNSLYAGEYRRAITRLFLAQHFTRGLTEVVDLIDMAWRILLCYLAASMMSNWSTDGQSRNDPGCFRKIDGRTSLERWLLPGTLILISACHGYGLLKGYR